MSKLLIPLVILCLIASMVYRKWAVDHALKRLYEIRATGDSERFIKAVDADFVQIHFSPFTREFMKLNYWIDMGQDRKAEALIPGLESMKCSRKDRIALYSRLLGYTLDRRRYPQAENYLHKLQDLLRGRNDRESLAMKQEIQLLDGVYFKKDPSLIPILEEALEKAQGENASILCYRLAKLYHAKGDAEQVNRCLEQALRLTRHEPSRKALEEATGNHSLLD